MEYIVKEICKFIINNLYDNVSLNEMDKYFYYSREYIKNIFEMYTGYTINEFINTLKVLKTIDSLICSDMMVLQIALNNGYNSQEYYSKQFQEVIGVSPVEFRKMFSNIETINDIDTLNSRKEYLLYLHQYLDKLLNMSDNLEKIDKIKNLVK